MEMIVHDGSSQQQWHKTNTHESLIPTSPVQLVMVLWRLYFLFCPKTWRRNGWQQSLILLLYHCWIYVCDVVTFILSLLVISVILLPVTTWVVTVTGARRPLSQTIIDHHSASNIIVDHHQSSNQPLSNIIGYYVHHEPCPSMNHEWTTHQTSWNHQLRIAILICYQPLWFQPLFTTIVGSLTTSSPYSPDPSSIQKI